MNIPTIRDGVARTWSMMDPAMKRPGTMTGRSWYRAHPKVPSATCHSSSAATSPHWGCGSTTETSNSRPSSAAQTSATVPNSKMRWECRAGGEENGLRRVLGRRARMEGGAEGRHGVEGVAEPEARVAGGVLHDAVSRAPARSVGGHRLGVRRRAPGGGPPPRTDGRTPPPRRGVCARPTPACSRRTGRPGIRTAPRCSRR